MKKILYPVMFLSNLIVGIFIAFPLGVIRLIGKHIKEKQT